MQHKNLCLTFTIFASVITGVFLFFLFYGNETKKLDLLSGLGIPGERWEKWVYNGQHEAVEFIRGDKKTSPLRGARNAHIKNISKNAQGKIIYDVDYFYDSFGRRTVVGKDEPNSAKRFALFFGCSDLLGVGVNSVDTIPSIFSSQMPEYKSYNYGFPGTALHYVNRMIEAVDFTTEVSEKNGIFVYVVTEGHYAKSVIKILHIIRPVMPQYSYENKELKYAGSIEELSPISSNFKKYVGTSLIPNLFNDINNITKYSQEEHEFICSLLKNAQNNFLKKYRDSRFIVLLHHILPDTDREYLRSCAQRNNIEFVDIFLQYDSEKFSSDPIYFHPTRALNEVATSHLVEYLKLNK